MPEQTGSLCALPRSTVLSVGHRASICRQNMDNQDSYMVAANARTATTFAFSPGQAHDAQQGSEMLGGLVSRISRRPTRRRGCTGMAKGARRNWCIWATCSWTIVREPGKAFSAGDLGLTGGLAGLQEGLPLDGLAKEFDDSGCLGNRWCYWRGPTLRDGAHDPVGGVRGRSPQSVPGERQPGCRGSPVLCGRCGTKPPAPRRWTGG